MLWESSCPISELLFTAFSPGSTFNLYDEAKTHQERKSVTHLKTDTLRFLDPHRQDTWDKGSVTNKPSCCSRKCLSYITRSFLTGIFRTSAWLSAQYIISEAES